MLISFSSSDPVGLTMVYLLSMQALLEVNGHIADLRREAGKVASEEQGDVLEILPVQLLFGEY